MSAPHPIDLAAFGASRARGFVPEHDPLDRLPDAFRALDDLVPIIPALIMNSGHPAFPDRPPRTRRLPH